MPESVLDQRSLRDLWILWINESRIGYVLANKGLDIADIILKLALNRSLSQGDNEPLKILAIPERYNYLPASKLDASVLDLAYLYHAFANSRADNADHAPDFNDAVKLHKLIDVISIASESGSRRTVTS